MISYLVNPSAYDLGETVAVIGMGNVARSVFRGGAQRILCLPYLRALAGLKKSVGRVCRPG